MVTRAFGDLVKALRLIKEGKLSEADIPKVFWEDGIWGDDFFRQLVFFEPTLFGRIPSEAMSPDVVDFALSTDGCLLKYVPENSKTRSLCVLAVKQNASALSFVPDAISAEIFRENFASFASDADEFWRVPSGFLDEGILVEAIEMNPLIIEGVETGMLTDEMCAAFLRGGDHPYYLEDVKWEARSRRLVLACLRQNRGPRDAIPRLMWDSEIEAALEEGMNHPGE